MGLDTKLKAGDAVSNSDIDARVSSFNNAFSHRLEDKLELALSNFLYYLIGARIFDSGTSGYARLQLGRIRKAVGHLTNGASSSFSLKTINGGYPQNGTPPLQAYKASVGVTMSIYRSIYI